MTFDHSHYVPILKGKKGELLALAKADNLQKFTPLVEVIPIPREYPDEGDSYLSKSMEKHIKDTAASYKKAMGILPRVFIDGRYIEGEKVNDGSSAIGRLFSLLRSGGIKYIPTIGLDRVEDYANAVCDAIATAKNGCCLRLWESDLESLSDLDSQIMSLLRTLNVATNSVDLLIDFQDKVPPKVTLPLLLNALPRLDEWRTLTLSSSAFPQYLSDVATNTIEERERSEWLAWVYVRAAQNGAKKRIPTFGDYGINHPTIVDELDPRMITVSPNIRYTSAASYVIAKGKAQPRKKKAQTDAQKTAREQLAPSIQYPNLAAMIKGHPSWKDRKFSWGDDFIDRCSQKRCTGTGSDWRGVGASHHIAVVAQQIANLP
jgi:hypothetical protein